MESRTLAPAIMKAFVMLVILSSFHIGYPAGTLLASSLTYQRDYSYQASEADSKLSCRTIALEQVKRLLLEELGSYLTSHTEVRDFQVSKDQIVAMTAGIVGMAILTEKWDGHTYYISAKVTADPNQVAKAIREIQQDPENIKEVEKLKSQTDEIVKELKMLREELKAAKAGEQTRDKKDYDAAVKKLSASDWHREGNVLLKARKYRDAISFYNKALDADPKRAGAYHDRGNAYWRLRDFPSALRDYNESLVIRPNFPNTLLERATLFVDTREFDKALVDINKALELKPDYAKAYNIRAYLYLWTNNFLQAIEDCNKAIQLDPNYFYTYTTRAAAYRNLKRYDAALKDYQKSLVSGIIRE